MQKKLFLVMLLVACIALSGCSLVVKDAARDAQQVIVDVNGETVDKQTIQQLVTDNINYTLSYYSQLYAMYGRTFNASDYDTSGVPQQVIDSEVQRLVLSQKFAATSELALTAEEEEEIQKKGKEQYDAEIEQVKTTYLSKSEKEGDELTAEAQSYALTLDKRFNLDYFVDEVRQDKIEEKLRAYAIRDVAVTEDETKAEFDTRVAKAKEDYAADATAFGKAANDGDTLYYRPAGYRYVKQILVGFPTESSSAISTANSAVTTAQTALNNAQTALDDHLAQLAAEGLSDEEKATLEAGTEELRTALDTAKADLEQKTEAASQALADAFTALQPTLDEVTAKIEAGEDFDALIEQYNTDPGMKREPGKTNGYAVCAGYTPFETAFVDAAMALEKVGDVSQPVRSDSYGYYIIRYQSDIEEGEAALDDVRSTIESELLTQKQNDTYTKTVEQWTKDAAVKTYIERLSN